MVRAAPRALNTITPLLTGSPFQLAIAKSIAKIAGYEAIETTLRKGKSVRRDKVKRVM